MLNAQIIGNIGGEPEARYSQAGQMRLQFNVASNYRTRSQDGNYEDKTEWCRVTVFGNRAESLSNHLRKGMRVYVSGRLEARPWTTKDGDIRAGLELIANDVEFMSSRQDDEQPRRQQPRAAATSDDDTSDLPF